MQQLTPTQIQSMQEQAARLQARIDETKRKNKEAAIEEVLQIMKDGGLTLSDLRGITGKPSTAGQCVAIKYRNQATGETWTGRGLKPKWLARALAEGKSMNDFLVQSVSTSKAE